MLICDLHEQHKLITYHFTTKSVKIETYKGKGKTMSTFKIKYFFLFPLLKPIFANKYLNKCTTQGRIYNVWENISAGDKSYGRKRMELPFNLRANIFELKVDK